MTISTTATYARASGNGVTTVFNFSFEVFASTDLVVRDIVDATGVATTKTLTTDYSVAISATAEGGTVTFVTAPAAGHTVDIRSVIPLLQGTSIRNQGSFHPELHEGVFDRLERQIQDTRRLGALAMRLPDSELPTTDWDALFDLASRKGKYGVFFNATTGAPELYASIGATTLSQSVIGAFLYPRTAAEIAAGVTPTLYYYLPGDIRRYGATSGGSAATNTTAIQAAIDSNDSVYVPTGTFSCNTVTLKQGSYIHGDGLNSIISQNTITNGSYGTLYANSGAAGTQIADIVIENLQVLGNVSGLGFSKFQHLISLNGVTRATVRNCFVKGFRGDGIYIGSGTNAGDERHNSKVKILNNIIDGVNNDNRNGVSVIDGDDVLIEGNTFVNCTRSNMPGAIDIEPDAFVFHVVRNIRALGNTFKDCGGNVSCISLVLTSTVFTTQPETFIFNNNTFDGTSSGFVVNNSVTSYARPLDVQFCNNSGKVADLWQVFSYVDGIVIANNTLRFTGNGNFGPTTTDQLKKAVIKGNTLIGNGVTANCFIIRSGNGIIVEGNLFDAIVGPAILIGGGGATLNQIGIDDNNFTSTVSFGVSFGGGTVTNLRILDNDFTAVAGTAFFGTVNATARIRNNKGYVSENGAVTAAIATAATVTHGMAATPTIVTVTALDTGPTNVFVSAIGATTFAINYGGGGSHVFAWEAKTSNHYAT